MSNQLQPHFSSQPNPVTSLPWQHIIILIPFLIATAQRPIHLLAFLGACHALCGGYKVHVTCFLRLVRDLEKRCCVLFWGETPRKGQENSANPIQAVLPVLRALGISNVQAQPSAVGRTSFVSFVGFYILQQEGKAASTTIMRTGKGMRGVYEDTGSLAIMSLCFEVSLVLAITTLKDIYRIIISIYLTAADCRCWRCLSQFIHCTCTNTAQLLRTNKAHFTGPWG